MIHLGLDEAGYGPLLGPLVVGAAAFRVEGAGDGVSLRERLAGVVCDARGPRTRNALPVAIDDSKAIHGRFGVEGLARGVGFAAAGAARPLPSDLRELLDTFGDRPAAAFEGEPWFAGTERARVPTWAPPAGLVAQLEARRAAPALLLVSPATARELNEAFDRVGNKARVLFLATAALLVRALAELPGEDVSVVLDRQGGRLDYDEPLAEVFPWQEVRREPAEAGAARYAFEEGGRRVRLAFLTKGDARDLSTGLASMAAKLVRELFMARWNDWFRVRMPAVRPTAGYVEDGRRFLADVAPVLERERIDLRTIVRSR